MQFLCEMAAAWQMCVDSRLGIFAEDSPFSDPLAKLEDEVLAPNPPYVSPHHIWTKVSQVVVGWLLVSDRHVICSVLCLLVWWAAGLNVFSTSLSINKSVSINKSLLQENSPINRSLYQYVCLYQPVSPARK